MKLLLKTLLTVFAFAGILAGCFAVIMLVILMLRFPPLLIAVVLACWIYTELKATIAS